MTPHTTTTAQSAALPEHTCPVWVGHLLASPLRRLVQSPKRIVGPHLQPGMTVLDVGSAMGFFSIPMARWVNPGGRVICVDLQQPMLDGLGRRARKAGVLESLELRRCEQGDLGIADLAGRVDFALAFAMVHEAGDPKGLVEEIAATLAPGGRLLIAEPRGHVTSEAFADTVVSAEQSGLRLIERPRIRWSRAGLFVRR